MSIVSNYFTFAYDYVDVKVCFKKLFKDDSNSAQLLAPNAIVICLVRTKNKI